MNFTLRFIAKLSIFCLSLNFIELYGMENNTGETGEIATKPISQSEEDSESKMQFLDDNLLIDFLADCVAVGSELHSTITDNNHQITEHLLDNTEQLDVLSDEKQSGKSLETICDKDLDEFILTLTNLQKQFKLYVEQNKLSEIISLISDLTEKANKKFHLPLKGEQKGRLLSAFNYLEALYSFIQEHTALLIRNNALIEYEEIKSNTFTKKQEHLVVTAALIILMETTFFAVLPKMLSLYALPIRALLYAIALSIILCSEMKRESPDLSFNSDEEEPDNEIDKKVELYNKIEILIENLKNMVNRILNNEALQLQ